MNGSEFAFLALGLILGTSAGAALVVVLRARPAAPREVRVTVAPDSLARPTSTLAHQAVPDAEGVMAGLVPPEMEVSSEPDPSATASPRPDAAPTAAADEPVLDAPRALALGLGAAARRDSAAADGTNVSIQTLAQAPAPGGARTSPAAVAVVAGPEPGVSVAQRFPPASAPPDGPLLRRLAAAKALSANRTATPAAASASPRPPVQLPERTVAVPIEASDARTSLGDAISPGAAAMAMAGGGTLTPVREQPVAVLSTALAAPPAPAVPDMGQSEAGETAAGAPGMMEHRGGAAAPMSSEPSPADPCAELRRVAAERRQSADRAAAAARVAADALRDAQRAYDEHVGRAEQAERDADARAVREAKDVAQRTYHEARAHASTPQDAEAAARVWLQEVDALNRRQRDGKAILEREQAAGRELLPRIERLTLDANAARITSESAAATSREASEAVALCDETALAPAPPQTSARHEMAATLAAAEGTMFPGPAGLPLVIAMVRGDRVALDRAVTRMAGNDQEEARRWRILLADLVDAIVAGAIASSYLDFPAGHRFWGPFAPAEAREIVAALASLGYRFDALGGFADSRVPSQRDLSLAVGYAGLDPMRIRVWPGEAEMPNLFQEAVVAADEWLAEVCGDLTLGEMLDGLGSRADSLADVWNAWGRLRPILLEDA